MDVVQNDNHWSFLGKVAQENGKALNKARVQRLVTGKPSSDRGNAAEHAGEIVEHAPAEAPNLGGRKPAEMPFEGLPPETERGGRSQRIGSGRETGRRALVAVQQLPPRPGLSPARGREGEGA